MCYRLGAQVNEGLELRKGLCVWKIAYFYTTIVVYHIFKHLTSQAGTRMATVTWNKQQGLIGSGYFTIPF